MPSYNKIILMGHLTRDPELTYTPANVAICKGGLAVNHKWKDKDGNTREEVCFVDFVFFGKQAETFNQFFVKGRAVLIEGRLKLEQWTSKEGQKRSKHSVQGDRFVFVDSKQDGDRGAGEQVRTEQPKARNPDDRSAPVTYPDDDIPF